MTKDEILEKSRKENKGFDEREQQTRIMGWTFLNASTSITAKMPK